MFRGVALSVLLTLFLTTPAVAASADDNVEWAGVSHYTWMDMRPLCPVGGETFEVRFQSFRDDLTGARVRIDDGSVTWIDACRCELRGPYDVWTVQIPATASDTLSYYIELTDGSDVDFYSIGGMTESEPAEGHFVCDFVTLNHAPVGASPSGTGTVFKVWAPTRTSTHVRGAFNGWSTANPMDKVGEHFITHVPGAGSREQYKYFFNNTHWNTDARARGINATDNYNAYIEDPFGYVWQIEDFEVPAFEEMVIYQLHVGTFAGRNDPYGTAPFPSRYADVPVRAPPLAELGINAVMLNPINEFPGDHSAGYNPISNWAPEWIYGTPDDLKAMVDALHQEGIAVLLDIVWNHFSFDDNFMWFYDGSQIYFDTPAIETPWGSQADFDNEDVRDYYAHSAHYWLEEFKMDGFRMDATDYMNIDEQEASGWSLMQRLNNEVDNRSSDKFVLAEQLPDDDYITRPTVLGGAGFDAQYYDNFTDRLREEIINAAFGDPNMWQIRNIINGSGTYLSGRYVVNYLELHDECWPTSGGQRIVKTIDSTFPHDDIWAKGRYKLAQGLVLTAPGIPAMLQGAEWLEDTDFGTDSENRIDWSKKITYAPIFEYMKDVITLRTSNPALRADASWDVFHTNDAGNVLAFQRYDGTGNVVVVVVNFSNSDYTDYRIGLPQPDVWTEVINSQSSAYDGNGLVNAAPITAEAVSADGFSQSAEIVVAQMGLIILRWGESGSVDLQGDDPEPSLGLVNVSPSLASAGTQLTFSLHEPAVVRASVYDLSGRKVIDLGAALYEPGRHTLRWDGESSNQGSVPAGVYTLRLTAGNESVQGKVVILR